MRTKFKLLALASAALMLGACADEIVPTPEQVRNNAQDNNAITFSTYMGRNTRAGATGSIGTDTLKGFKYNPTDNAVTWTEANAKAYGFGVFAYYTGTKTYQDATSYTEPGSEDGKHENGTTGQTTLAANFMFNQLVWWNDPLPDSYITKWSYEPLKYWPNEVAPGKGINKGVDDQDGDTSSDPAYAGSGKDTWQNGEYGGNVSFFAYAPYVDLSNNSNNYTDGITAINSETTLGTANAKQTDPIITYIVASDGSKIVDLLWGTYNGTSQNVLSQDQPGVSYKATGEGTTNYTKSILPHYTNKERTTFDGYTVNADLTKQKTTGTIGFAFKHALAKVGGSNETNAGVDNKHGLMVVLDLDDMMGAETGGVYTNTGFSTGKQTTLVTITDVQIDANAKIVDPSDATKMVYLKQQQGDLNLATGYWKLLTENNTQTGAPDNALTKHIITSPASSLTTSSATLADDIAEPNESGKPSYANSSWSQEGVITVPKNVYKEEVNPLVFIPGTYPELTITIEYTVRTYDPNLASSASGDEGTWTKVKQKITKKVTFTKPVELNKQYSLLMHLGLTSVKFTATVSDWELAGDDNGNGIIDGEEILDVQDAYLPINVGGTKFNFTSFSAEKDGDIWGSGVAELTGNTKTIGGEEYYEIVVRFNDNPSVEAGTTYYIHPDAKADGVTRYQLYGSNGTATNPSIWVSVSRFEPVTYYFTSTNGSGTEYSSGTARTTGNYKIDGITNYAEIEVVTNYGDQTFAGKTYYIDANATANGTVVNKLYDGDLSETGLYVKIAKEKTRIYEFTSWSGTTEYSKGIAKTTGAYKTFDNNLYAQVLVICNDNYNTDEWVGKTYYIDANAQTDGTKYGLKEFNGIDVSGVEVSIAEYKKYNCNFTSYPAEASGTQYTTGTAKTTGNFAVFDGVSYQQIIVTDNVGIDGWTNKCFYVVRNAEVSVDGSKRYQLRRADGSVVDGIWIAVTSKTEITD